MWRRHARTPLPLGARCRLTARGQASAGSGGGSRRWFGTRAPGWMTTCRSRCAPSARPSLVCRLATFTNCRSGAHCAPPKIRAIRGPAVCSPLESRPFPLVRNLASRVPPADKTLLSDVTRSPGAHWGYSVGTAGGSLYSHIRAAHWPRKLRRTLRLVLLVFVYANLRTRNPARVSSHVQPTWEPGVAEALAGGAHVFPARGVRLVAVTENRTPGAGSPGRRHVPRVSSITNRSADTEGIRVGVPAKRSHRTARDKDRRLSVGDPLQTGDRNGLLGRTNGHGLPDGIDHSSIEFQLHAKLCLTRGGGHSYALRKSGGSNRSPHGFRFA